MEETKNENPMLTLLKKVESIKKEIGKVVKDKENPFFKSSYTDVNSLLEKIEPLFKKEGLLLIQPIRDGKVFSEVVDLKTGQSLSSSIELPDITDPQKIGSAITYYRRYTLTSLFALQSEEDDDGNSASGKVLKPKTDGAVKMVTMKQGKLLESLGMKAEDIRKLTSLEASGKIKLLTEK
jgi:hypothetical protein